MIIKWSILTVGCVDQMPTGLFQSIRSGQGTYVTRVILASIVQFQYDYLLKITTNASYFIVLKKFLFLTSPSNVAQRKRFSVFHVFPAACWGAHQELMTIRG